MNLCNHCQAELICDHVPANRIYQCPACGYPNSFGDSGATAGLSKFARKSMCYALGALVLLVVAGVIAILLRNPLPAGFAGPAAFLLGIVATYLGIRAFLLARYQPFSRRSKYEAISGVVAGSCLGIFAGGVISLGLIVGLVAIWFNEETSDPTIVAEALQTTFKFESPDSIELIPSLAKKTAIQKRIELWDHEDFGPSRNRLYLLWTNQIFTTQIGSAQANRNGIRRDAIRFISGNLAHRKTEPTLTEELEWMINGKAEEISKVTWQLIEVDAPPVEGSHFVTYQCLFDANDNTYCLTFLSELPGSVVSESEIKAAFESFEPIGTGW